MKRVSSIESIVFISLFAALTFVGTTLKIPLPTGAFVHLGNAVLLLAVLLLGYVRGSLAGGIGFAIFDLFNGYVTEAPYFIVESFVVGGVAYLTFLAFKKNPKNIWQVAVIGLTTGVAKLVMTQLKNTVVQLMLGNSLSLGFTTALVKLPATVINVSVTILVVVFLYFPMRAAFFKGTTNRIGMK